MANTVFNPQVLGKMISAGVAQDLKFKALAVVDDTLKQTAGDTITLPKYLYAGPAVRVLPGQPIPIRDLRTDKETVTVSKVGGGFNLLDEDIQNGYGDPKGEAKAQITRGIVEVIDTDSLTAILTAGATRTVDLSTEIVSPGGLAKGLVAYGEDDDGVLKVGFFHPEQIAQLRMNPSFIDVTKMTNPALPSVKGEIWGVQLASSLKVENVDGKYINPIVKHGAIGILRKRDILVEEARDIETQSTMVVGTQHYVVWLKDESKVVKVEFAEATPVV